MSLQAVVCECACFVGMFGSKAPHVTYSRAQTPPPNGGKGLVHIEHFLGLADLACLNSVAPMSSAMLLTYDYNVILHHCSLLLVMRVVDTLLCQNDASHMTSCILCAQGSTRRLPDPFLACMVGSGNVTTCSYVCALTYL